MRSFACLQDRFLTLTCLLPYSPLTLSNITPLNLVSIFRCDRPPNNPVFEHNSVLVFSLSLYRHLFVYILLSSRFIYYNKHTRKSATVVRVWRLLGCEDWQWCPVVPFGSTPWMLWTGPEIHQKIDNFKKYNIYSSQPLSSLNLVSILDLFVLLATRETQCGPCQ